MQKDMHYYAVYAIARAAGLSESSAEKIAFSSQFVDEAIKSENILHNDGGSFQTIATAHTSNQAVGNAVANKMEQRSVWVPFHFYPGNKGKSFSDKLKCIKDSELAQEMVQNHIRKSVEVKDEYGLYLMGIMAHVYADTFAHYGFSGVSSRANEIDPDSFELDVKDNNSKNYIVPERKPRYFANTSALSARNIGTLGSISNNFP